MEQFKQLPFTEPPFCTYQYYASPGVAAMQNPTAYNHYLNQCMILACGRRFLHGYTSPDLSINGAALEYFDFIERIDVPRRPIDGVELQEIRNLIDEGYYVCYNMVDNFYIDGCLWSGEIHNLHDGLICGYDDRDRTLTLVAYDSRWIYRSFKTSQEGFQKALSSGKERGGYDGFIGIRARKDEIQLNPLQIAGFLEDYLTPDPYGRSFEGPDPVRGIAVHNYLRLYLQFILEGEIPYERMDRRIMRLLSEHKKCMLDRIHALEERFGLSDEVSSRYRQVVESSNCIRLQYAVCKRKRRDDLLVEIMDKLKEIELAEYEILPVFLKTIKEKQNALELSKT